MSESFIIVGSIETGDFHNLICIFESDVETDALDDLGTIELELTASTGKPVGAVRGVVGLLVVVTVVGLTSVCVLGLVVVGEVVCFFSAQLVKNNINEIIDRALNFFICGFLSLRVKFALTQKSHIL